MRLSALLIDDGEIPPPMSNAPFPLSAEYRISSSPCGITVMSGTCPFPAFFSFPITKKLLEAGARELRLPNYRMISW